MIKTEFIKLDPQNPDTDKIKQAALILRDGGLVAFPTETVYGLGANLSNKKSMERLIEVKERPNGKLFSVHISNKDDVEKFCLLLDEDLEMSILNNSDPNLAEAKKLPDDICEPSHRYEFMGDFVEGVTHIDNSAYCEVPLHIFTDKSTPTKLLPKVQYHQNNILVNPNDLNGYHRIYRKHRR